jgi:hypothetical protein
MPKLWGLAMRPGDERRAFKATEKSAEWRAFMTAYRKFIMEEVGLYRL